MLLALAVLVGSSAQRACALEHGRVHVWVAPESCPDATLLTQALSPLLAPEVALVVDARDAVAEEHAAVVTDQGERYQIQVGEHTRVIEDPARDCSERARVSAVLIALNVNGGDVADAPTPEPEPTPPVAVEPPSTSPEVLAWGVRVFGAASYAPSIERGALGFGVGVERRVQGWHFGFDAAWQSKVRVELDPLMELRGSVAVTRMPLWLSVGHLWSLDALRVGPMIALELDVLRVVGEVEQASATRVSYRVHAGAYAALDVRVQVAAAWQLVARLGVSAFPRAYRFVVMPDGQHGQTPALWLSGSIGGQLSF